MIITYSLLDIISSQAKKSPRLRMNYNLHETLDATVQRLFNAMEPGTVIPIQRHRNTAETIMLVRGKMKVVLYDNDRNVIESAILSHELDNYGVHIPAGVWHWVEILEPNTVMFEVKKGPYEPLGEEDIMV
jgi:cupin fold WbuC family metalloprotein